MITLLSILYIVGAAIVFLGVKKLNGWRADNDNQREKLLILLGILVAIPVAWCIVTFVWRFTGMFEMLP